MSLFKVKFRKNRFKSMLQRLIWRRVLIILVIILGICYLVYFR